MKLWMELKRWYLQRLRTLAAKRRARAARQLYAASGPKAKSSLSRSSSGWEGLSGTTRRQSGVKAAPQSGEPRSSYPMAPALIAPAYYLMLARAESDRSDLR